MSMEMILVFLLVAYGIWLAVYFHWESRQRKDEKSETLHLERLHEFCRSILIAFAFRSQIVLEVRNEHVPDFLQ